MSTDDQTEESTELTDDRPHCFKCKDYITEWAVFVREGYWTGSEFEDDPIERHWCKACYQKHHDREAAAHYEIKDSTRLWAILEAADGELVIDTHPVPFSNRLYVRVVDGEPQALAIKPVAKEPKIISFEAKPVEFTRKDFDHVFGPSPDAEEPTMVYLKPSGETPFAEWEALPDDQSTLELEDQSDE
jgi:hypothetical protein